MEKRIYSPEEISKKFESLPDDIKKLVYSADMLRLIQTVGTKYKLHIDQLDTLEAETADVMTGFSKFEDFVPNLVESLSIDKGQAEGITKDINEGLFLKIRESMKQTYEAQKEERPVAITRPAAVATAAPAPTTPPTPAPMPAKAAEIHPADLLLTQKSVSASPAAAPAAPTMPKTPAAPMPAAPATAPTQAPQAAAPKVEPVQPKPYAADPYREPIQ